MFKQYANPIQKKWSVLETSLHLYFRIYPLDKITIPAFFFKALSTNITGASEGLNQLEVVKAQLKYTSKGKTASHTLQCSIYTLRGKKNLTGSEESNTFKSKTGLKAFGFICIMYGCGEHWSNGANLASRSICSLPEHDVLDRHYRHE